jgi:hypothetical protein
MTFVPVRRFFRIFLGALFGWLLLSAPRASAHDPFDVSSRITVYGDRIELSSTLGADAAREFLQAAGFTAEEIAGRLKARGPETIINYSLSLAPRFFELKKDGAPVAATRMTSRSEGMEIFLTVSFARPAAGTLEVRASCYETIAGLKAGVLIVDDEAGEPLGAAKLSRAKPNLTVQVGPLRPRTRVTHSGNP